jgi:chromosomal replication initiation ATPase DnaA
VEAVVIDYILARMERSFAAAERLVGRLDGLGLALGRRITVPLARRVVEEDVKEG